MPVHTAFLFVLLLCTQQSAGIVLSAEATFQTLLEGSPCWTVPSSSNNYCPPAGNGVTSCSATNSDTTTAVITNSTFNLDSNAVVGTITLTISHSLTGNNAYWTDLELTVDGSNYSASPSASLWQSGIQNDTYNTFVGKSQWTRADLMNPTFGVIFRVHASGTTTVNINCIVVSATYNFLGDPTPSPSPSPSPVSPSSTPSVTPSPSKTPSSTPTPSATPSRTPTPSVTPSSSKSPGSSSSPTPSLSVPSTSPSPSSNPTPDSNRGGHSSSAGLIAGTVVAAVVVLAGAALVAFCFVSRRRKNRHNNNGAGLELKNTESVEPIATSNNNADLTNYQSLSLPSTTEPANQRISVLKADKNYHIPYSEITLEKEVGRGAFGSVWKGKWRSNSVAVKKLIVENMNSKQMDDFLQEMILMKSLRPSPNVVLLLGVCDDPACVVTEFCENGSLLSLLRSDKVINEELTKKIVKGIAKGMLHLHLEGVVHRDLAARNVLLTASFEPKIRYPSNSRVDNHSDFGLSRLMEGEDSAKTNSNVGPLKWMAPECIRDRVYSKSSDVWAFGITLIEIFTRQDPYGKQDALIVASRVSTGELVPEVPSNAPQHLTKVQQSDNSIDKEQIMSSFFAYKGSDRPDFQQICGFLDQW